MSRFTVVSSGPNVFVIGKLLGIWTLEIAVITASWAPTCMYMWLLRRKAIFGHFLPGYSSFPCIILLQDDVRDPPQ